MNELLTSNESPDWFTYPEEFLNVIHAGAADVGPWQFLSGEWLRVRQKGLAKRFPERSLVPFARRLDNDDIACWDGQKPGHVCIVHDFSAPGWEERNEYASFDAWHEATKDEARDYDD